MDTKQQLVNALAGLGSTITEAMDVIEGFEMCIRDRISSSTASGSFMPLRLKNLMPLNSGGLCEAEMTMPPSSSF